MPGPNRRTTEGIIQLENGVQKTKKQAQNGTKLLSLFSRRSQLMYLLAGLLIVVASTIRMSEKSLVYYVSDDRNSPDFTTLKRTENDEQLDRVNNSETKAIDPIKEEESRTSIEKNKQADNDSGSKSCFEKNTKNWLQSRPKVSNIDVLAAYDNDTSVIDRMFDENLIDSFPHISGDTLCHKDGWFRSAEGDWNASDTLQIEHWTTRLMYLALHSYHHAPARAEYRERRRSCMMNSGPIVHDVGSFDYECPQSKFLVNHLSSIGMGASFRSSAVTTLLAALATDRIPILINNADRHRTAYREYNPTGNVTLLTSPSAPFLWSAVNLFSCERGDMQCVLLPTTPCTLTLKEVMSAPHLTAAETYKLRGSGELPAHLESNRVITFSPRDVPSSFDKNKVIRDKIYGRIAKEAMHIVNAWKENADSRQDSFSEQYSVLKLAVQAITKDGPPEPDGVYHYPNRASKIAQIALMYFMRPNPSTQRQINKQLGAVIPASLDPSLTLGLPIRGSDKCLGESTCLPFQKYMQLAEETWVNEYATKQKGGMQGSLILTTEDPSLFAQRHEHSNSSHLNDGASFPWNLVVNEADVLQGSGSTKVFANKGDEIMMSSFIALKMQMHASKVYGNCCSNFHVLLFDFARNGCGMARTSGDTVCMQDTKDYNLCCQWNRSQVCNDMRAALKNATNS